MLYTFSQRHSVIEKLIWCSMHACCRHPVHAVVHGIIYTLYQQHQEVLHHVYYKTYLCWTGHCQLQWRCWFQGLLYRNKQCESHSAKNMGHRRRHAAVSVEFELNTFQYKKGWKEIASIDMHCRGDLSDWFVYTLYNAPTCLFHPPKMCVILHRSFDRSIVARPLLQLYAICHVPWQWCTRHTSIANSMQPHAITNWQHKNSRLLLYIHDSMVTQTSIA